MRTGPYPLPAPCGGSASKIHCLRLNGDLNLTPSRMNFIPGNVRGCALRGCAAIASLAFGAMAWAQSELPPKVQADIFRQEIVEAARNHQPQDILVAAEHYRALQTQGIQVPPGVFYLEATAAKEIGDHLRAYDALMFYLKVASSADIYYRDALHLYPLYAADPAVKARLESKATLAQEQAAVPTPKTSTGH